MNILVRNVFLKALVIKKKECLTEEDSSTTFFVIVMNYLSEHICTSYITNFQMSTPFLVLGGANSSRGAH